MKVLVTGGCGFIGQHLVQMLVDKGERVLVLDIEDRCATGSVRVRELVGEGMFHGDVCDPAIVDTLVSSVDIVFHLAAQSHVDASIANPLGSMYVNAVGTQIVAAACAKHDTALVYCSTDEVYGDNYVDHPSGEYMTLNPSSPYSAGKAAGEFAVRAAARSLGLERWAITRGCNAFGQNQYTEKLIPIVCNLIQQGKPVTIHDNGTQIRQWIHVEDFCRGLMTVGRHVLCGAEKVCPIYNLAGPRRMSVLDLVVRFHHVATGKHVRDFKSICNFVGGRPGQDWNYNICDKKMLAGFGFKAKRDIWSEKEIQLLLNHYGSDKELMISDYSNVENKHASTGS